MAPLLYGLKGEIMALGVSAVTGLELPVFEKRRFQAGAFAPGEFSRRFSGDQESYRRHLLSDHGAGTH